MSEFQEGVWVGLILAGKVFAPFRREWVHDNGGEVHTAPHQSRCSACEVIVDERIAHHQRGTIVDDERIEKAIASIPSVLNRKRDDGSLNRIDERVSVLLSDGLARTVGEIMEILRVSRGSVKSALYKVARRVSGGPGRGKVSRWTIK